MSCGHSFTYHSVIPPSHCPICGACLMRPYHPPPYYPSYPHWPYWQQPYWQRPYGPFWNVSTTTGTNTA